MRSINSTSLFEFREYIFFCFTFSLRLPLYLFALVTEFSLSFSRTAFLLLPMLTACVGRFHRIHYYLRGCISHCNSTVYFFSIKTFPMIYILFNILNTSFANPMRVRFSLTHFPPSKHYPDI